MENLLIFCVSISIFVSGIAIFVALAAKEKAGKTYAELLGRIDTFYEVAQKLSRAEGNLAGREERRIEQQPQNERDRATSRAEGNLEGRAAYKEEQIPQNIRNLASSRAEGNLEGRAEQTAESIGQKNQIDENTQRIIDEIIVAIKENPDKAKAVLNVIK